MKPLDVIEQIRPHFIASPIRLMGNTFPFEQTEETFTGSVIATMTDGTHTANQRVATQKVLVVSTGELPRSECRITDQSPWRCQIAISTARITICRSWR